MLKYQSYSGFYLLYLVFSILSLIYPPSLFSSQLERGPYIENMGTDMVTIRFRTDISTVSWITYGAYPDCERFMTISPIAKEHKSVLFGLMSDTMHCYRIYLPDISTGVYKAAESTFMTFREPEKPYLSFIAFGNSGSGSKEQYELAEQMEKFTPDFILHTGNILESGLDYDADFQYFEPYKNLISKYPFFLALGNHDYGADFNKEDGKDFIKNNYTPYHSMPLTGFGPHYYFFDNGNARFICLDNNSFFEAMWAPAIDEESQQIKWLKTVLSRTRTTWKFVYLHLPLYSTGEYSFSEELRDILAPIFEKYEVDMVFQGHDHNYERTKPIKEGMVNETEGIVYVTLGGGGRPLYPQKTGADWSEKFISDYHFAFVEIKEKILKMTVYNKNLEIIDTLTIQK